MPHGEPQVAQQASVAKQSTRHTCAAHMQILKRTPRPHRCPTCKQSICSDLASFKPNRTATNLIRRMADLHLDLEEERSRSRTRSPPPRGYVQVFVRCWAGNTIVLDVPPDSDVQYIKELVFRREGTSASIACVFCHRSVQSKQVRHVDCMCARVACAHWASGSVEPPSHKISISVEPP